MTRRAALFAALVALYAVAAPALDVSVYMTAHTVTREFGGERVRDDLAGPLERTGAQAIYLEVYRGGHVVAPDTLVRARDYFQERGYAVSGGIATVPGESFGARQRGPLAWYSWFDWTAPETQTGLRGVMAEAGPLFERFIVDDFLAPTNESPAAQRAKGSRTWGAYRRDLMAELAGPLFVEPIRAQRPHATVVIKYPQWYDRFHQFGYDPARLSPQFDEVWVGVESRGMRTPRYGFVPAYQGFVNFTWLGTMPGPPVRGAWFDHGDCDARDFVDQAYISVLAGAEELMVFNYGSIAAHPGAAAFSARRPRLEALQAAIQPGRVWPAHAYKPAVSDPGADMYLYDYVGMLGVPLRPTAQFPHETPALLLATQAAADPALWRKTQRLLAHNPDVRLVLTTGFLATVRDPRWATLAGVEILLREDEPAAFQVETPHGAWRAAVQQVQCATATPLLTASNEAGTVLVARNGAVTTLNVATFTETEFFAERELLLAPKFLNWLELDPVLGRHIRAAFGVDHREPWPTLTARFPLGEDRTFVYNFANEPAKVPARDGTPAYELPPRSGRYDPA